MNISSPQQTHRSTKHQNFAIFQKQNNFSQLTVDYYDFFCFLTRQLTRVNDKWHVGRLIRSIKSRLKVIIQNLPWKIEFRVDSNPIETICTLLDRWIWLETCYSPLQSVKIDQHLPHYNILSNIAYHFCPFPSTGLA